MLTVDLAKRVHNVRLHAIMAGFQSFVEGVAVIGGLGGPGWR
jgi:hypothetical protein